MIIQNYILRNFKVGYKFTGSHEKLTILCIWKAWDDGIRDLNTDWIFSQNAVIKFNMEKESNADDAQIVKRTIERNTIQGNYHN